MVTIALGVAGGILLAILVLAFLPWIAHIIKMVAWLLIELAKLPSKLTKRIARYISMLPKRKRYALLLIIGFSIIVFSLVHSQIAVP
jgi:hypothetical protein